MAKVDEAIDLLVAVLLDHPAFQQRIEPMTMGIIETSDSIAQRIEDIVEDSARVKDFVQETASEQHFGSGEFRDAVRRGVRDMDFTVEAS